MSNYILPLKAPTPLPASGVDVVTFKVWKNTLIAHIQQDANHYLFMPGGLYSTWRASEHGVRIEQLHEEDSDKTALDDKRAHDPALLTAREHTAALSRLLSKRNALLAKFIVHIATLCHYNEQDDVNLLSTSLEWIFDYLRKHYGLETKGANFMNISDHVFKKGTNYNSFYKQYRASFSDNLRKKDDKVKYKNDAVLAEDEKLSPSFENAIILWTLEKIDPRLPGKVKKNYGHQMVGDVTLKDIQPVVFENISWMLEDLDNEATTKAFASLTTEDQPSLSAITFRGGRGGRGGKFQRGIGSGRGTNNNLNHNRGFGGNKSFSKSTTVTDKFCRICNLAGSDPRIYTSHEIGNCSRLTIRDLESLKSSLVLNGMIAMDETEYEPAEPTYVLQPGWDDDEAQDLQTSPGSD